MGRHGASRCWLLLGLLALALLLLRTPPSRTAFLGAAGRQPERQPSSSARRAAASGGVTVMPSQWQEILQNTGEADAVLQNGQLDFTPWLEEFTQSPHNPGDWIEDGSTLGQGAFGKVVRGINVKTGELVAIKRIAPTHPLAAQTASNELSAAELLGNHPNIVSMKAHYLSPEVNEGKDIGGGVRLMPYRDVVLIYRLALGGSLEAWITQQHGAFTFSVKYPKPLLTDESLRIMRELVTGLIHIHSKNVQHRDLKPANILISAGGTALIADLGIALVNRSSTRVTGHAALGDFYFIDVDSLVNKGLAYTLDDDIYSMGEVFIRILYGEHATGLELRNFVKKNGLDAVPPIVRVIHSMLLPRDERANLEDVLKDMEALKEGVSMPSMPRPIVTETFLGIGAVATAVMIKEALRSRSIRKVVNKKTKLNAVVRVAVSRGNRVEMQDKYCHSRLKWSLLPGGRSWRLLGVFDGQGGKSCAKFAARFLPHEVRRMFRKVEQERDAAGLGAPKTDEEVDKIAAEALREALESLDQLFIRYKERIGEQNLSGCTACVVLLSPDAELAVLGNIGDSHGVISGDWEVTAQMYNGSIPEPVPGLILTKAHDPADPEEQKRIDEAGGFVEFGGGGHRVNGVFGVSRAIGYAGVKGFSKCMPALADITVARRRGTKALIALASDGLFEKRSPADVYGDLIEAAVDGESLDAGMMKLFEETSGKDNRSILAIMLGGQK